MASFDNGGARGGSGNDLLSPDESYVRSVPSRITKTVPALEQCNASVTLTADLTNPTSSNSGVFGGQCSPCG